MKTRFFLLVALSMFFAATTSFAQRIAVLEFNAGAGISQADVEGISAIFNTYFTPAGYTLVERTQIDRVIDEQNFQRGSITYPQMVRIGQILNVSKVVIGDVYYDVMNQYKVDVLVVNVESGTPTAKDGVTWTPGSSYRTMMRELAARLASKIAIKSTPTSTYNQQSGGYEIGDYYDVGSKEGLVFAVAPDGQHGKIVSLQLGSADWYDAKSICANLGSGWRLPTKAELLAIYELVNELNSILVISDPIEEAYWSSTEYDEFCAWYVYMDDGYTNYCNKSYNVCVCAVSAF